MSTGRLVTTAGWLVALAACSAATMTAWLLVTAPTTTALAVQRGEAEPLAQLALDALYQVFAHIVRYF
jgi:hypothetical protein